MNDLKYACRKLVKVPVFTAVAVLTLALCLGANLVIFAVVDSVLLRPLPFREPDRLVTTINAYPKAGVPRSGSSLPNYSDPNVVGREMRVDGLKSTIVGVLPPGFRYLSSRAQLFFPLASGADERGIQRRHSNGLQIVARLKPGATLAEAQAQIDALNAK